MPNKSAAEIQKEIYVNGLRGRLPVLPLRYEQLREQAKIKLSKSAFDYLDGGAGMERTMLSNREAFSKYQLRPFMLRDTTDCDIGISLFGKSYPTPFFLSPIGVLELANREANLAVGRAAASLGIPFIFSNQASKPMEETASAMHDGPRFFQLYWSKSNDLVASLLRRAEAAGCDAIVVTLDTPLLGWRMRDLQQGFLPFLYGMGIAQYTSDPVFQKLVTSEELMQDEDQAGFPNLTLLRSLYRMAKNFPGNTWSNFITRRPLSSIRKFINVFMRTNLQWDDLQSLRNYTSLPIILKGIQTVPDAKKAIEVGVDAIMVSNHGGRQVDGAIGSLYALDDIAKEIGHQIPILFDSGIRSGADAVKAMALGAQAVGIGRPYAFALAVAGEEGVKNLLEYYLAEFTLTMRLCGCRTLDEVDRSLLFGK